MAIPLTLADALLTIPIIEAPNFNATFFGSQQATQAAFVSTAALEEMKNRPPAPPAPPAPAAKKNDSDEEMEEEGEGQVRTPKRRLNYTLEFKNKVIQYAERTNNCQAAIKYQVPRQCIQVCSLCSLCSLERLRRIRRGLALSFYREYCRGLGSFANHLSHFCSLCSLEKLRIIFRRWRQIKPELEELMQGTPHSSKKKRLGGGGRPLKNVELDEKLDLWLKAKIRERGTKITGKMIKEYAISIAGNDSFKASNGWLQRFMIRHGLAAPPPPRNAPPTPEESPRSSPEPTETSEDVDPPVAERKSTRNRRKTTKHSPESTNRRTSLRNQKPVGVASTEGGVAVPEALRFDDNMTQFMEAYRSAGGNPEDAEVVALLATLHHERGAGPARGAEPTSNGAELRDVRKEEPVKEAEPVVPAAKDEEAEPVVPAIKDERAELPARTVKDERAELPARTVKDERAEPATKKKEAEPRGPPAKKRAEPEEVGDTDSSTSSTDDDDTSSSSSDSSDEE
ncbi:hypothetical protein CAEBREN_13502 [Caenorhabditis brenneri]|uniref:HTH CENPB-type domain-containing protein n=1 Tax=Caenorhabditis brenneri TaxID=135651 RepID=G0NVJ7_CAEBE|nr:hypothetical protein CAEBREN_13502 [Caenorhabditis brenneri]